MSFLVLFWGSRNSLILVAVILASISVSTPSESPIERSLHLTGAGGRPDRDVRSSAAGSRHLSEFVLVIAQRAHDVCFCPISLGTMDSSVSIAKCKRRHIISQLKRAA